VISVISPFYNEASIIEAAITQMLANLRNLHGAWEFIVVDDGSTDGSEEIARRLATQSHPYA
jgi:glycosyltransferase involved in cell wall biosynthesis